MSCLQGPWSRYGTQIRPARPPNSSPKVEASPLSLSRGNSSQGEGKVSVTQFKSNLRLFAWTSEHACRSNRNLRRQRRSRSRARRSEHLVVSSKLHPGGAAIDPSPTREGGQQSVRARKEQKSHHGSKKRSQSSSSPCPSHPKRYSNDPPRAFISRRRYSTSRLERRK